MSARLFSRAGEKYAAFVPHGVHTQAHSFFFLLWLLFLQDNANHPFWASSPSLTPFFFFFPFSVSYVFAFHFSVRKLWDGISTYLGLSHSVHATAASRPRLGMLSWLLFSALATLVSFVGALSFLSKCQSNQFMSPL